MSKQAATEHTCHCASFILAGEPLSLVENNTPVPIAIGREGREGEREVEYNINIPELFWAS